MALSSIKLQTALITAIVANAQRRLTKGNAQQQQITTMAKELSLKRVCELII